MPRRRKQHWNDLNPGSQRYNRQNPYNSYQSFQRNTGQTFNNSYSNQANFTPGVGYYYDNSAFQTNYPQNYSNNYYDPSFQRNFPQNRNQSHFNQNYQTNFNQNARNTDYNPNFQSNVPRQSMNDLIFESNIKTEDIEKQEEPSSIKQKDSIKNIKETPVKSNPWYIAQPDPPQKGSNQKPKFTDRYNKLTERFTEKGYIIKETLYRDPSLFYANSNSVDSPSDNESNDNNWTDTFWQKHDNTDVPKHSKTSQSTRTVPRKNQNKLERSLNDMLAKPAEMSKGKSLLLKMGWQGGGLGREEDGIVEPIAPRATYAVKTIGLGHLTEKPEKPEKPKKPIPFANISNKKLKHPEFQSHFCTNVLLYILEFVKNDEENKIVFEPRLRKLERKRIHLIVEKIRESDNLEDFENFENFLEGHLELVKEIWVHNCYELWTESEGKKKNRRLCLFKEAPAHVYLVTPEDLTENDKKKDDVNDKNDDNDVNIKEEKDSEKIDGDNQDDSSNDTERDSDSNIIEENFKKDQGNEKFNSENTSQDIKKEISELTDSQMAVDSNMDGNNQILVSNENKTLEMTQKVKDSDFCCEIVPNMEINELHKKDQENDFNSEDSKIDTSQGVKKKFSDSTDSQMAMDTNMDGNNQIVVTNHNNTLEIVPNMEINDKVKKEQENDKFNSEGSEIDTSQDINKEISDSTDSQMAMDTNMDGNNQIVVTNHNNTLEIVPNMEINDKVKKEQENDKFNSEGSEIDTSQDINKEISDSTDSQMAMDTKMDDNNQIVVTNHNNTLEIVPNTEINDKVKKDQENDKFNSEGSKIDTSQDINKEISDSIDSQMAMDINMEENNQIIVKNDYNTIEMTQNIGDIDYSCEIIPNSELSEVIMISSDESDSESTEMTTNDDLSHEIKPNNDKNVEIVEENQSSVQNENKVSEGVADINICTDIKFEIKIKEEYTKICEKMTQNDERTYHDYLNSYSGLFIKTENPRDEKGSILSKIVKYFKEFSTDETFKEFRFLGPFNSEQIMQINAFFKICMKQDNIENCYEKNDLLAAFDNGLVKFDVLEDNNGKRFIKKAGELPSEDEDEEVKYASGLYL
ncbi:putative uncharacterized protein DDB_G0282133 isoform X2 [Maniola jurtina]|uniref:putative uncharacterized protein DDB_G0282133 isoform X2 n=1 Tax=Maniola jurtina TaxID=191418 RepID=UPI001E685F18|nr:putative uncharacterized protein DDB_G0282133 isoform X2 [Maniola jurtina]